MAQDSGGQPLSGVARVLDQSGRQVGAGFLVTPTRLLTAAHVVNLAGGRDRLATPEPEGLVVLDFLVAAGHLVRAHVIWWVPPGTQQPEDLAVLRLLDQTPDAATPLPLVERPDPAGREITMLGFPRDAPYGGWCRGRLLGPDGRGLVQVDVRPDSQFDIEEGFSGTAVWDTADRAVTGMVLEAWRSRRRSGFMLPVSGLRTAWPQLDETTRPPSPFRGLRPFTEDDAAWYFGRTELVERIVRLATTTPIQTVIGPSGVGKSSLLRAGVLPRLSAEPGVLVAVTRPGEAHTPLRSVALALARCAEPDRPALARASLVDDLAERLDRGLLHEVVGAVRDERGARRLVLVVDQLEELFTGGVEDMAALGRLLGRAREPNARFGVLAALRVDFLGPALQVADLAGLVADRCLVTVGELTQAELREVITGPVERVRTVRYEPGLVERLLDDAGLAPGRLPLVQFTLERLWAQQRAGVLTHDAYDELGRIDRSLANHAETFWASLDEDERVAAGRLLVQLLHPVGDGDVVVRRPAPQRQLDKAQWSVARRLAGEAARLVAIRDRGDGPVHEPVVELVHDSLVTHWQRLAELARRERTFRQWQEGLRERLRRWEEQGRPTSRLLSGADLRDAVRWQAGRAADISTDERLYVQASRRHRYRIAGRIALVVVLVLAIGGVAWVRRDQATADRAASVIAENAENLGSDDPYAELWLSLRAYRTQANKDSADRVEDLYRRFGDVDRTIPDHTLHLFDPNTGRLEREPEAYAPNRISADAGTLVTTDPNDDITIWRIVGDRVTPTALGEAATAVLLSRSGRYIGFTQTSIPRLGDRPRSSCATSEPPSTNLSTCFYLHDLDTGQRRLLFRTDDEFPFTPVVTAIDPTDQVAAAVYLHEPTLARIGLWNITDVTIKPTIVDIRPPKGLTVRGIQGAWLAPGARTMVLDATALLHGGIGLVHRVLLWLDLDRPDATRILAYDFGGENQLATSLDGRRIAVVVGVDTPRPEEAALPVRTVQVWDVATGARVGQIGGLTKDEARGGIGLDPTGTQVYLAYSGTGQPRSTQRIGVWSVTDGSRDPRTFTVDNAWDVVLPLGTGDAPALALVDHNAIGLMLPNGKTVPLELLTNSAPARVEAASTDPPAERWANHLCSTLASDVEPKAATENLPPGAYTGPICD